MRKGSLKIKRAGNGGWEVLLDGKNVADMVSHLSFDLTPTNSAVVTLELSHFAGTDIDLPDALIRAMPAEEK